MNYSTLFKLKAISLYRGNAPAINLILRGNKEVAHTFLTKEARTAFFNAMEAVKKYDQDNSKFMGYLEQDARTKTQLAEYRFEVLKQWTEETLQHALN